MRKTKIVCTIGPACEAPEKIRGLLEAGMDVARLNFSHGSHEEHLARLTNLRRVAEEMGRELAIMLDTKGPEIRTGLVRGGKVILSEGASVVLTTEEIEGDEHRFSISFSGLPQALHPGDFILINDGLIKLQVVRPGEKEIECRVVVGGELADQKGVNIPGVALDLPALTDKDISDIKFGIDHGVDFIAASFVRRASDAIAIRRILEQGGAHINIIAKIENDEGVNNIDEILKVVDGMMVARGDMGVVLPTEEVPLIQKMMIEKCNRAGKPVITATQMLESMIRSPRPTRAEASDVANAIMDGSDAVMLSGETAAGKYPVEAVKMMARIAERTEQELHYEQMLARRAATAPHKVTEAISHATCTTAQDLGAAAIITSTKSGFTARMVAKYRPKAPIVAVTTNEGVCRQLKLVWGVQPIIAPLTNNTDEMMKEAVESSLKRGLIKLGDLVVITAGVPVSVPGTTNLIKVHIVGEVLARGTGIGNRAVTGKVRLCLQAEDSAGIEPGEVMVARNTNRDYIEGMERAGAIITEEGGLTSHAAIVGISLGIPTVVGADGATERLEEGSIVTVDGMRGLIYRGETTVL